MSFATVLTETRKKYYPTSAKKAWESWSRRGLSVNYPYYMRLEQGKAIPSAEVVSQIGKNLVQTDREKLILSYCSALFPSEKNLFAKSHLLLPLQKTNKEMASETVQKELKIRQVTILAEQKIYYQVFVILLLARSGVEISELSRRLDSKSVIKTIKVLEEEGLLFQSEGRIFAVSTDVKFPDSNQMSVQKAYLQFDQWDQEFSTDFRFERLFKKKILRRVSMRHLQILTQQLELTNEMSKSADEVDARYNDEVILLELSLQRGKVPG